MIDAYLCPREDKEVPERAVRLLGRNRNTSGHRSAYVLPYDEAG